MHIAIDVQSATPIYTQLIYEIKRGIATGELRPGDSLPSVRSLGADLGINLHTVNKAYNHLKQDGLLHVHRQKGVTVNPNGLPVADEEYRTELKKAIAFAVLDAKTHQIPEDEFLEICHQLFQQFTR